MVDEITCLPKREAKCVEATDDSSLAQAAISGPNAGWQPLKSCVEYHIPRVKKQGLLKRKEFERFMERLDRLQDEGKYQKHERLASGWSEIFKQCGEVSDIEASVMIARGVGSYYENSHRISKKFFKGVLRKHGGTLENRELLHGRAYVKLATVYRYDKRFGKVFQCLEIGQQLLRCHEPGEDTAELYYYFGVSWLDFYWNTFADEEKRQVFRTRTREYFELAIDHAKRDERTRVQLKRELQARMRIAALNLECGTRAARQTRSISAKDLAEAKEHLDFVESNPLSDAIRPGQRIQLLKTRSDLHFREGDVRLAKETAQEALDLAKAIQRNMEIAPLRLRIEERVQILDRRLESRLTPGKNFSDSGCSGDDSSSTCWEQLTAMRVDTVNF